MTKEVRRFELGAHGTEYVRHELLTDGILGRMLAGELRLEAGTTYTEFPVNVAAESLLDFASGGKLQIPPPELHRLGRDGSRIIPAQSMNQLAIQRISKALLNRPRRTCLVFDLNARWEDPYMEKLIEESWILRAGAEIYHVLTCDSATLDQVERTFRHSFGLISFLGAISAVDLSANLPATGGLLDNDLLREFCRGAFMVFVGAYDGEGLVYWERAIEPAP